MTRKVEVNPDSWTLISTGKTRGIIENTSGWNLKVRVESVGNVPPDAEKWGHNLLVNLYFPWEKSSAGADIYVRTVEGVGELIVTEG